MGELEVVRGCQGHAEALEAVGLREQGMSEPHVEVITRAVAALNERDADRYLACCTDDIELVPPTAEIEGAYEGAAGVRRFLADIQAAMPDFRLDIERLESIGPDRVLVLLHATMSGRTTGIGADIPITNIYDLAGGKIRRVQVFPDRDQALKAARPRD